MLSMTCRQIPTRVCGLDLKGDEVRDQEEKTVLDRIPDPCHGVASQQLHYPEVVTRVRCLVSRESRAELMKC